jgi:hypothetical protein
LEPVIANPNQFEKNHKNPCKSPVYATHENHSSNLSLAKNACPRGLVGHGGITK